MFNEKKWECLKSELFNNGIEAIDDFCGFSVETDDKDTIDNLLDEIVYQMPEDILETYYKKYNILEQLNEIENDEKDL